MKHDMFYDLERRMFIPAAKLPEMGLPEDETELIALNFWPVEFRLPTLEIPLAGGLVEQEYDPAISGLEPDGEPEFSDSEPNLLVQKMRVVNYLENFRAAKKQELAQERWERQCAGIELSDGTVIKTSPDDFSRLAVTAQAGTETVTFKASSGWVRFDRDRLLEVIALAGAYIESCYEWERRLAGAIEIASSIKILNSIAINQGWPDRKPEADRS